MPATKQTIREKRLDAWNKLHTRVKVVIGVYKRNSICDQLYLCYIVNNLVDEEKITSYQAEYLKREIRKHIKNEATFSQYIQKELNIGFYHKPWNIDRVNFLNFLRIKFLEYKLKEHIFINLS